MGWRCFFFPRTPRGVRLEFYSLGFSSLYFNPRTPCVVRPRERSKSITRFTFQSTHPVWGATKNIVIVFHATEISIHAPRVGCDYPVSRSQASDLIFQSTHPVWGATAQTLRVRVRNNISIHAPRVGCDRPAAAGQGTGRYFNPRTPCGVRLLLSGAGANSFPFQSTHPVWGATLLCCVALRIQQAFQSTHPVWGATRLKPIYTWPGRFQSTHPVWGATWPSWQNAATYG